LAFFSLLAQDTIVAFSSSVIALRTSSMLFLFNFGCADKGIAHSNDADNNSK
jgi:hypothetical protein